MKKRYFIDGQEKDEKNFFFNLKLAIKKSKVPFEENYFNLLKHRRISIPLPEGRKDFVAEENEVYEMESIISKHYVSGECPSNWALEAAVELYEKGLRFKEDLVND